MTSPDQHEILDAQVDEAWQSYSAWRITVITMERHREAGHTHNFWMLAIRDAKNEQAKAKQRFDALRAELEAAKRAQLAEALEARTLDMWAEDDDMTVINAAPIKDDRLGESYEQFIARHPNGRWA
jgi:hypothetical protein